MNPIQRRAETRLAEALATLDTLEHDRDRFAVEVTACESRELELRKTRASIDELAQATSRTSAARSLLEQTELQLDAARVELGEAEREAQQERRVADLIALAKDADATQAEITAALLALEPLIAPVLELVLEAQGKLEDRRREFNKTLGQMPELLYGDSRRFSLDQRLERTLAKPGELEAKLAKQGAGSFAAVRGSELPETAPSASAVFRFALRQRHDTQIAEYQENERRERLRRQAARSSGSYS